MAVGSTTRVGETLAGRYRLERHLADDESAEVYAATDVQTVTRVVVRVLHPEHALVPQEVERFVGLPKALVKLSPPHLTRVFAVGADDSGIPFVVEEEADGESLASWLARRPDGFARGEAKTILAPVIEAFARLHMAGLVHGHMDPRCIVLCELRGQLIPRVTHHAAERDTTGAFGAYVAPEQRRGHATPDPLHDVWSLGVLMHQVLTGRMPAREPSAKQLQQAIPELAPVLAAAMSEALCPEPDDRIGDAAILWMRVEATFGQIDEVALPSAAASRAASVTPSADVEPEVVWGQEASLSGAGVPSPHESSPAAPPPTERASASPSPKPERKPIAHLPGMDPTPRHPPPKPAVAPAPTIGTQSRARTPGSLNDAQLRELLHLGTREEKRWQPWARVVLLLLLLLLFWRAVPWLMEPDFAAARRVLGPQLRIAGIALSVVSVASLFALRGVLAHGSALVSRPVAYVARAVVLCVCVIVVGSLIWGGFGDSAAAVGGGMRGGGRAWRMFGGMARTALPFGVAGLMAAGALLGLLHAVRSMREQTALAIAALILALGGGAAAFNLSTAAIAPELERIAEKGAPWDEAPEDRLDAPAIKERLKPRKLEIGADSAPTDLGRDPAVIQRTSVGDDGDTDVMSDDFRRQRARQGEVIKAAEKEVPAVPR